MSKPQKSLKEFSQLTVMKRVDIAALAINQVFQRLEAERAWEPRPNTQLHRIWKLKKLNATQQRGWQSFRMDAENAYGCSGPVTSAYGDLTDGGGGDSFRVPTASENDAHRRVEYIFNRHLVIDEALLLRDLIRDDVQNHENFNIELVGFLKSAYKKEETARANGIGHIQALLTRLGRLYGY